MFGKKRFKKGFKKFKKFRKSYKSSIRRMKPETKFWDNGQFTTLVQASGAKYSEISDPTAFYYPFLGLIPGTTAKTRIGNKITLKSIQIKFHMSQHIEWTGTGPYTQEPKPIAPLLVSFRLMLAKVWDASSLLGSDFLDISVTADPVLAYPQIGGNWSKYFKTLVHKTFLLDAFPGENESLEIYKEFKSGLPVQFVTGGGASALDVNQNFIFCHISTSAVSNTSSSSLITMPAYRMTSRVKYFDS